MTSIPITTTLRIIPQGKIITSHRIYATKSGGNDNKFFAFDKRVDFDIDTLVEIELTHEYDKGGAMIINKFRIL